MSSDAISIGDGVTGDGVIGTGVTGLGVSLLLGDGVTGAGVIGAGVLFVLGDGVTGAGVLPTTGDCVGSSTHDGQVLTGSDGCGVVGTDNSRL